MNSVYVSALKRAWIVTADMEWVTSSEEVYSPQLPASLLTFLSFQDEAKVPSYPPTPQVGKL